MRLPALAAALLATAALAAPVLAHHSFAMFDAGQTRTLRGRVAEFRWSNPHVALFVQLDGVEGRAGIWSVELTSPGNLRRLGWERDALKRGDRVEVSVNPLRDGRNGGGFRELTLLDSGRKLTASLIDIERSLRAVPGQ
jgi:hypothetical protein